jgi:serine/threonine protein kinase
MAKWIRVGRSVGKSETRACRYLEQHLPENYTFYSNVSLTETSGHSWDYDVILLGQHAVYVIELKNYGGTIRGDRYNWILPGRSTFTPPGDILTTADNKARALKAKLKQRHSILGRIYVHSCICLTGRQGQIAVRDDPNRLARVRWLKGIEAYLMDESALPIPDGWNLKTDDIVPDHCLVQDVLDNRGVFKRLDKQKRIGNYEIISIAWRARRYIAFFSGREESYPPKSLLKVYPIPDSISKVERRRTIRRFEREISALRRIRDREVVNPKSGVGNVIAAYDTFLHPDGRHYVMVMEWVDGHLLNHTLQCGEDLSWVDRVGIAAQICRGLACAHRAGIVHRNLTPENVIVAMDGTAKLINFDFAKFLPDPVISPIEIGTPTSLTNVLDANYMAPEILAGSYHQASRATDVYSAGLVLSELSSGVPPALGKRMDGGGLDQVPSQSRELLNEIIGTMCAPEPSKRFELSLYDIAEYLDAIVEAGAIGDER